MLMIFVSVLIFLAEEIYLTELCLFIYCTRRNVEYHNLVENKIV